MTKEKERKYCKGPDEDELVQNIEKCINSLGEKFIKWPYNFFTESDAHSFLYYYIFRSKYKCLKVPHPCFRSKDKCFKEANKLDDHAQTVLIHREYPTSFRYKKKKANAEVNIRLHSSKKDKCDDLEFPNQEELDLYPKRYGRGHYDLIVLNPEFMEKHAISDVIASYCQIWCIAG